MPGGPKPQPTQLKVIRGNPGKRPLNEAEPKPSRGIPFPPDDLSEEAKIEWLRVVPELDRLGLLTMIDRSALVGYCDAWGRWVYARRAVAAAAKEFPKYEGLIIETVNGNWVQNPALGIANKAMADVMRYCVEFGMTPSARSRIAATPRAAEEDPAAEFIN